MSSLSSSSQVLPRIVTLAEIEAVVSSPTFASNLVDALRDGFMRQHDFYMAPIQTLGCPPVSPPFQSSTTNDNELYCAQTCVKTGYFVSNPHFVIKVASGGSPFPANSGLLQLYSQSAGRLEALLLDEGLLTELRTAAVGTLAFELFAPSQVQCVGVLGCGVQARYQLQVLGQVMSNGGSNSEEIDFAKNALVYGRDATRAAAYADEMKNKHGWNVQITSDPNDLLDKCDVVFTTTSSRQALLSLTPASGNGGTAPKFRTQLFICIGSDAPGKSEVDASILEAADLRVADSISQSRERGEFQSLSSDVPIVSLKDVLHDPSLWRKRTRSSSDDDDRNIIDDNRLVVFDSSGLALQDCVIAAMVLRQLSSLLPSPLPPPQL